MHIQRMKDMKEALVGCVSKQINGNLDQVDAKELGEAVDMIKDLEEALYYATITKAMEEQDEKESKQHTYYYTENIYPRYMEEPMMYYRGGKDMYRRERYPDDLEGIRYYNGNGSSSGRSGGNGSRGGNSGSTSSFYEFPYDRMIGGYDRMMPMEMDPRAGRSYNSRKTYMEGKESHHDKTKQIQELEKYMQELGQDMTEMIEGASPEEKALLVQKLNTLATKIK